MDEAPIHRGDSQGLGMHPSDSDDSPAFTTGHNRIHDVRILGNVSPREIRHLEGGYLTEFRNNYG